MKKKGNILVNEGKRTLLKRGRSYKRGGLLPLCLGGGGSLEKGASDRGGSFSEGENVLRGGNEHPRSEKEGVPGGIPYRISPTPYGKKGRGKRGGVIPL